MAEGSTEQDMGRQSLIEPSFHIGSSPPSSSISRRTVFQGAALMGLPFIAGCSDLVRTLSGDPGEITVFNDSESTVSATVSVTNLREQTTVLSETVEIETSDAMKFNDVFGSATQYRFEIETADGLSDSHEWNLPSTNHFLYITITSESIEFKENSP